MQSKTIESLKDFIITASECSNEQIFQMFEEKTTEKVRDQIFSLADECTTEPVRSAMFNIGFTSY